MNEKLPPYFTLNIDGLKNKVVRVFLPKYVPEDNFIDVTNLEKDGYSTIIRLEGKTKNCFFDFPLKGNGIKVEILPL